jgi:L-asparaginase
MATKRSKICVLFCGGTKLIGRHDITLEVRAESDIARWLDEVPELRIIADLEPVFIVDGSEQSISSDIWIQLAQQIKKRYAHYDGFVIMHAFDSMVHTGVALSFMLQNLGKPVILTGAQENKSDVQSGGTGLIGFRRLGIRANLINAVQVATMDIAEVGIMFGNRLMRATRVHQSQTDQTNLIDSGGDLLGKVDFGIKLNEVRQRRRRTGLLVRAGIASGVVTIGMNPGMKPRDLIDSIGPNVVGVILRAKVTKLSTNEWSDLNRQAKQRKLPLFLTGLVEPIPTQQSYLIAVPAMTEEVLLVKVMWVLGQARLISQIRELITANLADEFLADEEVKI